MGSLAHGGLYTISGVKGEDSVQDRFHRHPSGRDLAAFTIATVFALIGVASAAQASNSWEGVKPHTTTYTNTVPAHQTW